VTTEMKCFVEIGIRSKIYNNLIYFFMGCNTNEAIGQVIRQTNYRSEVPILVGNDQLSVS